MFDGLRHQSYTVAYSRNEDCPSHEPDEPIDVLDDRIAATQAGAFLERVRHDLGPDAVIDLNQDVLRALYCAPCQEQEARFQSLGKVTAADRASCN